MEEINSQPKYIKNLQITMNYIIKYKFYIFITIISFFLINIAYRLSKSYRVNYTLSKLSPLKNNLFINSQLSNSKIKKLKLCDFHITTAFRPYMVIRQHYDYCSLKILEHILMTGVRCIYIDVFNDSLKKNVEPVLTCGFKEGEWKLTVNYIKFSDFCASLRKICFNPAFVSNFHDPFILLMNLNTNNNIRCLNKIKQLIYKNLSRHILDNKYTYSKRNIMQDPIENFKEKIIIIANDECKNTDLEELVNYSWDKEHLNKINFKNLEPKTLSINTNELIDFNRHNMTIVVPDESNSQTQNSNPDHAFKCGCQFVAINYQKNDKHLRKYLKKFKNDSFLPKSDVLRGTNIKENINLSQEIVFEDSPMNLEIKKQIKCPELPPEL